MQKDGQIADHELHARFQLEEYKQVMAERRFVMTRYMQALALYLMLSGFAARELVGARSRFLLSLLVVLFTVLNVLAIYAAARFRSMAYEAMRREKDFAAQYKLNMTHELSWGYVAGLIVVALDQLAVFAIYFRVLNYGWIN